MKVSQSPQADLWQKLDSRGSPAYHDYMLSESQQEVMAIAHRCGVNLEELTAYAESMPGSNPSKHTIERYLDLTRNNSQVRQYPLDQKPQNALTLWRSSELTSIQHMAQYIVVQYVIIPAELEIFTGTSAQISSTALHLASLEAINMGYMYCVLPVIVERELAGNTHATWPEIGNTTAQAVYQQANTSLDWLLPKHRAAVMAALRSMDGDQYHIVCSRNGLLGFTPRRQEELATIYHTTRQTIQKRQARAEATLREAVRSLL
ncbi:MAG: hypothetical protein ABIG95_04965 [Candidatus Woesearchaeota archaeon]